jgi:hypothetical protein
VSKLAHRELHTHNDFSRVELVFIPWISGYTWRSLWNSVCAEIVLYKPFYLYALRNSWQHSANSTDFHAAKVWLLRNHLTTLIWDSTYITTSKIKKTGTLQLLGQSNSLASCPNSHHLTSAPWTSKIWQVTAFKPGTFLFQRVSL